MGIHGCIHTQKHTMSLFGEVKTQAVCDTAKIANILMDLMADTISMAKHQKVYYFIPNDTLLENTTKAMNIQKAPHKLYNMYMVLLCKSMLLLTKNTYYF